MAHYARVVDGIVLEISDLPADPAECMVAALADQWKPVDGQANAGDVRQGWTFNNGVFAAPVATLQQVQAAQIRAVDAEVGALIAAGYTWQGKLFQTDLVSQQKIAAMATFALAAVANPDSWPANFGWVATDNTIVPMTAANMLAFAQAVGTFVSAVLLKSRVLKNQILAAGSVADVQAIDIAAGWPAAAS